MSMGEEMECARRSGIPTAWRRLWGYAGASPAFDTNALEVFSCACL
jgi:hypothetical protein